MSPSAAGTVVWITGLPGAGKTTIAHHVCRILRERPRPVVRLDGDLFREIMGNDLGYGLEDRRRNARRLTRLCKMLSDQGLHVVCATVSLFREIHDWNRANFLGYREIYLRVTRETLLARDQKGLVRKAIEGEITDLIGIDQPFDAPADPHLVIDNDHGAEPPETSAARIAALVPE